MPEDPIRVTAQMGWGWALVSEDEWVPGQRYAELFFWDSRQGRKKKKKRWEGGGRIGRVSRRGEAAGLFFFFRGVEGEEGEKREGGA